MQWLWIVVLAAILGWPFAWLLWKGRRSGAPREDEADVTGWAAPIRHAHEGDRGPLGGGPPS